MATAGTCGNSDRCLRRVMAFLIYLSLSHMHILFSLIQKSLHTSTYHQPHTKAHVTFKQTCTLGKHLSDINIRYWPPSLGNPKEVFLDACNVTHQQHVQRAGRPDLQQQQRQTKTQLYGVTSRLLHRQVWQLLVICAKEMLLVAVLRMGEMTLQTSYYGELMG